MFLVYESDGIDDRGDSFPKDLLDVGSLAHRIRKVLKLLCGFISNYQATI